MSARTLVSRILNHRMLSGRSGSRTRKALFGPDRLPTGSRRLSGGPSVKHPDQESNPERLVRTEV
jgi:hypothetical protein